MIELVEQLDVTPVERRKKKNMRRRLGALRAWQKRRSAAVAPPQLSADVIRTAIKGFEEQIRLANEKIALLQALM